MTYAIDVHGLNKSFGRRHVVKDVEIQVEEGNICCFLGPNGAGKTTTLRMLCGLLTPDSGSGLCLGLNIVTQSAQIKLKTGYMPQGFALYEELSIQENLEFFARMHELPDRRSRVDESLERLGLAQRRRQLARELSGGWKRRLALAAAILHRPRLLLLDEPTAGVDPEARRAFWEQIHALAREGMTVLVSTHYMDEAERCHEIAYIVAGRLKARGTAEQVVNAAGLITYEATGGRADHLAIELARQPGVKMAAPFGKTLHVSGTDRLALQSALEPWRHPPYAWREIPPSLEDVFIHLMGGDEGEPS